MTQLWVPKFPQNKFIVSAEQLSDIKQQYPALTRCSDRRLRKWLAVASLISGKGPHRIRAHRAAWFMFDELQHYTGHDCNLEAQYISMRRSGKIKTSITEAFSNWLSQHGLPGKVVAECSEDAKTFISVEVDAIPLLQEIGNQFIAVGQNLYTFKSDSIEQAYSKPTPTPTDDIRVATIATASSRLYCPVMPSSDAFKHVDTIAKYDEADKTTIKQQLRELYSDGFRPEYQNTSSNSRLFAVGTSIQTLPSSVKKELFPSWREVDLQGAWAKIAGAVVGVVVPDDLWSSLLSSSVFFQKNKGGGGGRGLDEITNHAKPATECRETDIGQPNLSDYLTKSELKPHLYAMICGIGPRQTKANLTQQFGKEISESITSINWWNELGTACEHWRKQYMETNKATVEEARTAMALKCGEIEQDLMQEVYKTSQEFPRVQIVSAEHDGCSVVCSNEGQFKTFMKLCNVAIGAKAAAYGISMKLVEKPAQNTPVTSLNAPPVNASVKCENEYAIAQPALSSATYEDDFNYEDCDF